MWPLAYVYDPIMRGLERKYGSRWRPELLGGLSGRVLEIGAGTGANLAHYPDAVERVWLTEPDRAMRSQLERKLAQSPLRSRATVSAQGIDALTTGDGPFDAVVSTLVLCTVPDLDRAVARIRELLRPGGQLVFLEHVASDDPSALRWQERLDPAWTLVAGGCHLARRTAEALERGGFAFERLERTVLPRAPRIANTMIRGVARL